MNLDEVINQLTKIKETTNGDKINVRIKTNGTEHGIREIELVQAKWDSPEIYPKRVLISLRP